MTSSNAEREGAFRSHAGYLRAIEDLALGDNWAPTKQKLDALATKASHLLPAAQRSGTMTDELRGCLHRAWGTELILATTQGVADDTDIVRLANSWGSVQAYYVFYSALQALLVAQGKTRPTQHEQTKKQYINEWVGRGFILEPWTVGLGHPGKRPGDSRGFQGATPELIVPGNAHVWSYSWNGDDAFHVLGQALKGTRTDRVEEAILKARQDKATNEKKEWRKEELERLAAGKRKRTEPTWKARRNLTAAEKATVEESCRVVSLMDYMYRLRIKANYEDAQMFTDGPDSDNDASAVLSDLHMISVATLLVHEIRVARLLKRGALATEMEAWAKRNASGAANSWIEERAALIRTHG